MGSIRPQVRVLHLSDLHLTESGFDEDGVDAHASLARILEDCSSIACIDVIVASGDIADDGSEAGYADAKAQVGEFARSRAIPHVYCTGNHDERGHFTEVLGSGHLNADGTDGGTLMTENSCRAAVSSVKGMRVITLDSLVPATVHGWISDDQISWLRSLLAQPAPLGSIVVMHHPPISVHTHPTHEVLHNRKQLAESLAGSDVHAVL